MSIKQKISQLSGLISAFGVELRLNEDGLKKGEQYLLIQELECAFKHLGKLKEEIKKEFEEYSQNLSLENDRQSKVSNFEGAEVFYKLAYIKPKLDIDKLEEDYKKLLLETYNIEFDKSSYLIEQKPKKTLIIQSILNS